MTSGLHIVNSLLVAFEKDYIMQQNQPETKQTEDLETKDNVLRIIVFLC